MKFIVPARPLGLALANVGHAAGDASAPAYLRAVHLSYADGDLHVSATNKSILLRQRVEAAAAGEAGQVLLPIREVKTLAKNLLGVPAWAEAEVELQAGLCVVSLEAGGAEIEPVEDPPLIEYGAVIEQAAKRAGSVEGVALMPGVLAVLGKLRHEGLAGYPLRFRFGSEPTDAIVFTLGELAGVVMPVRTVY